MPDPSSIDVYKKSDGEYPPPGLELLYSLTDFLKDFIKVFSNRKKGPYLLLLDFVGEFLDPEKFKARISPVYN